MGTVLTAPIQVMDKPAEGRLVAIVREKDWLTRFLLIRAAMASRQSL